MAINRGRYMKHLKRNKNIINSKIIIAILFIIIVILLIVILTISKTVGSSGGVNLVVDKNAGQFVPSTNDGDKKINNVAITGWGSITIPANKKKVEVRFENPIANKNQYYLTFELRLLNDSEQGYEVLYKSNLVEPGLCIQNIELLRSLKPGTYKAVVHVQPYRMDANKTPTNNANMQTKLIVI